MCYFLGIDVGTSSLKLTVTDETGEMVAAASRRYTPLAPKVGWGEIDPLVWWTALREAMKDISLQIDTALIAGVCATGQMHTIVLVDEENRPVCKSILWNDLRTADKVVSARDAMKAAGESCISRIISTGSPAIDLAWTRDNDPVSFERAVTFVGAPEWIACKLGGEAGIDWCGASTSSLYSIERGEWSKAACAYFGVPMDMLPEIRDSGNDIGRVCTAAAHETGIPEGTPIVQGTGDNPAAAIPTGCMPDGLPVVSLGTSGVLMYAREGLYTPDFGKPVLFRSDGNLKTLVQLSMRSCGSDMEWWAKRLLHKESFDLEDKAVEALDYDMRSLVFYPHLNGVKTIRLDPSVRGAFLGLSLDTSRSEMMRAVMEGIAFGFKELMDHVEGAGEWKCIRLIGGGSNSDLWTSILCNVLDVPLIRLNTSGAGQGAAMIALSSATGESLSAIARNTMAAVDQANPLADVRLSYSNRYQTYLRIYEAIRSIYA